MTLTLAAPAATLTFTLRVEDMPARLRGDVEKLMLLLPPAQECGDIWFTRWRRAPDRTYSCRETLCGPEEQVAEFARELDQLAREHNFVARISACTYSGLHE